jgi:polyhydroxybutyrate depolymerase
MINKITKQINIDKNKIFSTGMSNGGMMSYRLACEMSDVIKGIAAVAGTDNTTECNPKFPVSILHIHAKNDDHVLYNGGIGSEAQDRTKVTDFQSVPATIQKWVKLNSCNESPKRVLEKDKVYCDLYTGCKNNVEVKLCVTEDGGHSWPGGQKFIKKSEPNSKAISANDVIWDFFN